jgi:hypothetical protein
LIRELLLQNPSKLVLFFLFIVATVSLVNLLKNETGGPPNSISAPGATEKNGEDFLYTKHGRCRMDCRKISEEEIEEAFYKGEINRRKSDPKGRPCPVEAKEIVTAKDRQKIRVIFGLCTREVRVITAIDLNFDHPCFCD